MIRHIMLTVAATAFAAALHAAPPVAAAEVNAKELWDKKCASCHGRDGKGQTPQGRRLKVLDYTTAEFQARFTDEELARDTVEGFKDERGRVTMRRFDELNEAEVRALVAYIRAFGPK